MNWIEINSEEARNKFEEYCDTKEKAVSADYKELREDLCALFDDALNKLGISASEISQKNNSYQLD